MEPLHIRSYDGVALPAHYINNACSDDRLSDNQHLSDDNSPPLMQMQAGIHVLQNKKKSWKKIFRKFSRKKKIQESSRVDALPSSNLIHGASVDQNNELKPDEARQTDLDMSNLLQANTKGVLNRLTKSSAKFQFFGPKLFDFFLPREIPSAQEFANHIHQAIFMNDIYLQLAPIFRQDSFELSLVPKLNLIADYDSISNHSYLPTESLGEHQSIIAEPLSCLAIMEKNSVNINKTLEEGVESLQIEFDVFCELVPFVVDIYIGLIETPNIQWNQYTKKLSFNVYPKGSGKIKCSFPNDIKLFPSDLFITELVILGLEQLTPSQNNSSKGDTSGLLQKLFASFTNFSQKKESSSTGKEQSCPWKQQYKYEWPLVISLSPLMDENGTTDDTSKVTTQANFFTMSTQDENSLSLHLIKQKIYTSQGTSLLLSEIYYTQETASQDQIITAGRSSTIDYQSTLRSLCSPRVSEKSSPESKNRSSSSINQLVPKRFESISAENIQDTDTQPCKSTNNTPLGKYFDYFRKSFRPGKEQNADNKRDTSPTLSEVVISNQNTVEIHPNPSISKLSSDKQSIASKDMLNSPREMELRNQSECIICMSVKTDFVVFSPCLHASVCRECAVAYVQVPPGPPNPLMRDLLPKYKDCPLCRYPIMGFFELSENNDI